MINLEKMGWPNYRVDGSDVYSFKFIKSGLSFDDCQKIQTYYKNYNYSYDKLADIFNTSASTVSRILKLDLNLCWKKLKPIKALDGRYYIWLYNKNISKQYLLHRLLLEVYKGVCPEGMQGCHNDGNLDNNDINNFRWDTQSSNEKDKEKHGTNIYGIKCYNSKLKDEDIINIRYLFKFCTQTEIGIIYNVSQTVIYNILSNKSWKHVK